MAGLNSVRANLKNIHDQAQMLTSATISLNASFEEESIQLTQQETVHRLNLIRTTILGDLERARGLESSARYAQTKADVVFSLTGSAIKLFTAATTIDPMKRKFINTVFSTDANDKPTFGTVMVCVSPKGLPGGIRVISISELARKSNRLESDVTRELGEKGDLILSEKSFSSLIDKLTKGVQEGHLVLPISKEKVAELTTPSLSEWRAVKISR